MVQVLTHLINPAVTLHRIPVDILTVDIIVGELMNPLLILQPQLKFVSVLLVNVNTLILSPVTIKEKSVKKLKL